MKKNKIVNKIGILVLAVMLSILSSITVLASEPEEAELGQRQDISKNLTTGEITVNEIPANLNKNSSDVMEPFIPEGMKVDPTTREVIGPDNRYRITDTTAYPNSAICYMEMKFPDDDGLYVGTAWMYGERVAMTAGHCVYDASLGGWAEWVRIYPGSNGGTSPYGVHYASVLHTDTKYIESENSNYDWGLLEFSSDIGSSTGYFGASWTTSSLVGTGIVVRGYPVEKNAQMWSMSGSIAASGTFKLSYYIDTTGGQSGSPVYKNDGNYRCVGIHTNYNSLGYNQAERIDESLFDIMNQYR